MTIPRGLLAAVEAGRVYIVQGNGAQTPQAANYTLWQFKVEAGGPTCRIWRLQYHSDDTAYVAIGRLATDIANKTAININNAKSGGAAVAATVKAYRGYDSADPGTPHLWYPGMHTGAPRTTPYVDDLTFGVPLIVAAEQGIVVSGGTVQKNLDVVAWVEVLS